MCIPTRDEDGFHDGCCSAEACQFADSLHELFQLCVPTRDEERFGIRSDAPSACQLIDFFRDVSCASAHSPHGFWRHGDAFSVQLLCSVEPCAASRDDEGFCWYAHEAPGASLRSCLLRVVYDQLLC